MKQSLTKIIFIGLAISFLACKQPNGILEKIKNADEIKIFYVGYEKAITTANYQHLAELYSDRGAIITAHGRTMALSPDSIRLIYTKETMSGSDFRFEKLDVELLGDSSAMVNAVAHRHIKGHADTSRIFYTAVLLKSATGWKIRHEHESPDINTMKNHGYTFRQISSAFTGKYWKNEFRNKLGI
jgi:ketosteroid isomerase-like protein